MIIFQEIISISLTAAPWLLFGLFAAGMIKAFVPEEFLKRWLSGSGLGAVSRAAVVGAPLPLCSCGAIPTALALYRGGAGRGPAVAFLIGTPGIGVDSVSISYALLGPFMAVMRALGAVITAVSTGLLVAAASKSLTNPSRASLSHAESCVNQVSHGLDSISVETQDQPVFIRIRKGMRYAFRDLLDDISAWILMGLVIAGLLITYVSPQTLAGYGSGLVPMMFMALIGIPLYICASAVTPIGAGMLMAGVSPGSVLVLLLAGPITSMATLGVLRREMGNAALVCYLSGIVVTTILFGFLTDKLVSLAGIDVVGQIGASRELLPLWLEWTSLAVLIILALPPARGILKRIITALKNGLSGSGSLS